MPDITLYRLIDGPICLDAARQERREMIADMAAALVANGAYVDHSDSIMTLLACGYPTFEVHALLLDARHAAAEHVAARQFSDQLSDRQRPEGER